MYWGCTTTKWKAQKKLINILFSFLLKLLHFSKLSYLHVFYAFLVLKKATGEERKLIVNLNDDDGGDGDGDAGEGWSEGAYIAFIDVVAFAGAVLLASAPAAGGRGGGQPSDGRCPTVVDGAPKAFTLIPFCSSTPSTTLKLPFFIDASQLVAWVL